MKDLHVWRAQRSREGDVVGSARVEGGRGVVGMGGEVGSVGSVGSVGQRWARTGL